MNITYKNNSNGLFTHSCPWSLSMPPENITKPLTNSLKTESTERGFLWTDFNVYMSQSIQEWTK